MIIGVGNLFLKFCIRFCFIEVFGFGVVCGILVGVLFVKFILVGEYIVWLLF